MQHLRTASFFFGMVVFGGVKTAYGDVVVSNLTQTPIGVDSGLNVGAQSFTMPGTTETLTGITLDLLNSGAAVDVYLYRDNSGLPGSSLLSLGTLTPTGGSGFSHYTASGSYVLTAGSTYWAVVKYLGSPSWAYTGTQASTGSGTLGPFSNSSDNGATWRGPFTTGEPYILEVDATAVPEPSFLGCLLLISAGAAFRMRKSASNAAR